MLKLEKEISVLIDEMESNNIDCLFVGTTAESEKENMGYVLAKNEIGYDLILVANYKEFPSKLINDFENKIKEFENEYDDNSIVDLSEEGINLEDYIIVDKSSGNFVSFEKENERTYKKNEIKMKYDN